MDNVEQEVIRLHEFFVEWMTGILTQTYENFALFVDSLSENFYIGGFCILLRKTPLE
jgi:hypothetical protein